MASLRVWIFSVVTTVEHKAETQVYEGIVASGELLLQT